MATSLQQPEDDIRAIGNRRTTRKRKWASSAPFWKTTAPMKKCRNFWGRSTDPLHGRIYDAVSKLVERGQQANPTTLKHVFDTDEFQEIGGHRYLADWLAQHSRSSTRWTTGV